MEARLQVEAIGAFEATTIGKRKIQESSEGRRKCQQEKFIVKQSKS